MEKLAGLNWLGWSILLSCLFLLGAFGGWVLELFYRRFVSHRKEHRWINPGFLTGPYLPLYGFGLVGLFLLSLIRVSETAWVNYSVILLCMAVCMTAIEYIAGIIFIRGMGIQLWDYSDQWGNVQGIICPLYTFFWTVVGALYLFLLHPYMVDFLVFVTENEEVLFFIGIFAGVFLVDFCQTIELAGKIKKFARKNNIVVLYERLKDSIALYSAEHSERRHFLRAFKISNLKDAMSQHMEKFQAKMHGKKHGKKQEKEDKHDSE